MEPAEPVEPFRLWFEMEPAVNGFVLKIRYRKRVEWTEVSTHVFATYELLVAFLSTLQTEFGALVETP